GGRGARTQPRPRRTAGRDPPGAGQRLGHARRQRARADEPRHCGSHGTPANPANLGERMSSASKPASQKNQKGGFVLGLIVGLLVGLSISLGVALYIHKPPIPFMNKVPQRTAEQDAQETKRNRNRAPNAPLAGEA